MAQVTFDVMDSGNVDGEGNPIYQITVTRGGTLSGGNILNQVSKTEKQLIKLTSRTLEDRKRVDHHIKRDKKDNADLTDLLSEQKDIDRLLAQLQIALIMLPNGRLT